tara:strand:+ start:11981 stop:12517 length:537 start_codon:yes stop_codon:yes gene_type:complete
MIELSDDFKQRAAAVKCVIFDVDGVLTDGKLFFDLTGQEYKSFHAQDGLGFKLLRQNGIEVAVISGRSSPIVDKRMQSLGIKHVHQGQENKIAALNHVLNALKLPPNEVAHVGDDLPDLAIMTRVGLAIAVQDANPAIIPYCHAQTTRVGGQGAAREVCDSILSVQDKLKHTTNAFEN